MSDEFIRWFHLNYISFLTGIIAIESGISITTILVIWASAIVGAFALVKTGKQ